MSEAAPDDDGDDRATVAEPAVSRRDLPRTTLPPTNATAAGSLAPSSQTSHTRTGPGATTIGSPLEALERDELLRTRWFCLIALAMVIGGGSSVFVVPGDPVASVMLECAVIVSVVAIVFLYRRTGDPVQFRRPSTAVGFFVPTLAVAAAIPFFGAFGPAAVLVVLAVYFTGLGASKRVAWAVYVLLASAQAVTFALVASGATRDTGLVRGDDLAPRVQWLIQALVQMVLAGTFVTARASRKSALVAVGELERAVRTATQREALLLEAREELERALRAGRGRFTGQVIGGYELGDVIGRGAMGEVYAAIDPQSGAPVAIKMLSQASLGNPQHVQRFFRELRTAAQIRSPHVVEVIAVGEQPVPYLVMERLDGKSLAEILRGRRQLAGARVAELVRQVGDGLAAAHAAGVIHRDIKPQNLIAHRSATAAGERAPDGTRASDVWKIVDFGVARLLEHGDTLTSGQIVGTPSYMAPEQARGEPVDARTDVYALAAVAYRALTGQPPFQSGEVAETLYRVVHGAPRRPSEIANVGGDVDAVLAIGLAKKPGDRFATPVELAVALAAAVAGALPDELRARGRALVASGAFQ